MAWITVKRSDFALIAGDAARYRSSTPVVRTFCGKCGTPLTYQHDQDTETIDVTTATLDQPDAFPPTRELWVEDKLAWEPLNEQLPHFRGSTSEASGIA